MSDPLLPYLIISAGVNIGFIIKQIPRLYQDYNHVKFCCFSCDGKNDAANNDVKISDTFRNIFTPRKKNDITDSINEITREIYEQTKNDNIKTSQQIVNIMDDTKLKLPEKINMKIGNINIEKKQGERLSFNKEKKASLHSI